MRTIGAYEAKTHLPRLLDDVARGERITITKHGRPVAVLVPPLMAGRSDTAELVERLRAFRRHHRLRGTSIRELIDDGRR